MEKEKILKILNITIIGVATTALVLLSYMLCWICFNLYTARCEEEFAVMIIGIIFTGTISWLLYTISVTWKEMREKH